MVAGDGAAGSPRIEFRLDAGPGVAIGTGSGPRPGSRNFCTASAAPKVVTPFAGAGCGSAGGAASGPAPGGGEASNRRRNSTAERVGGESGAGDSGVMWPSWDDAGSRRRDERAGRSRRRIRTSRKVKTKARLHPRQVK